MSKKEITHEDCINIIKWITATSMMVQAGLRTPFSESEHRTADKITRLKEAGD